MGCALPLNKVVQSPQVLIGSEGDLSNNALFGSGWLGTTGRWPIATGLGQYGVGSIASAWAEFSKRLRLNFRHPH